MIHAAMQHAMRSPLQSAMDRIGSAVWTPATLFAASEQGVWYDPSDFSTMYQDSAGTTPVTAVGQPVEKILDKSGRGNHATQATAAARGVYQESYSRIDLDGVDDGYLIGAIPTSTDRDFFIALRRDTSANGMLLAHQIPTQAFFGCFDTTSSLTSVGSGTPTYAVNGVDVAGGTATTRSQLKSAIPVGDWCIIEVRNVNMASYSSTMNLCRWWDSGFFIDGAVGGVVMCPAQDASTRTLIRQYLAAKVGVTL